jgi:hypothetical protein
VRGLLFGAKRVENLSADNKTHFVSSFVSSCIETLRWHAGRTLTSWLIIAVIDPRVSQLLG